MENWPELDKLKYENEVQAATNLLHDHGFSASDMAAIDLQAINIVKEARKLPSRKGLMETFLEEFGLSNKEGLALMCLAESLLRVPDSRTRDKLIAEKITSGDWASHKGQSDSWLVNASTLGLMLTGRVVEVGKDARGNLSEFMQNLTRRVGAPVIRAAMLQAMRILGEQFVFGRNIDEAIERSADSSPKKMRQKNHELLYSFDMLGEGAVTEVDAKRYFTAYKRAVLALEGFKKRKENQQLNLEPLGPESHDGISVKLSALHPRYDALHEDMIMEVLYPKLLELAQVAARANINLCLDAEEADRLVLSLKLLERLVRDPALPAWNGLGLAVQAYQKRARALCHKLVELSQSSGRQLMVRLVKGAYWDSEIKHGQTEGVSDYTVWTKRQNTDLCYLCCARILFQGGKSIYPQFATHNAHTVAAIEKMAQDYDPGGTQDSRLQGASCAFEYQRLHGMGEALYEAVNPARPVRVYAPVGAHEDLLPYLVRRLLENGANTSFVHSFLDEDVPPQRVARSPFTDASLTRHPKIPLPANLFGARRDNSSGLDVTIDTVRKELTEAAHREAAHSQRSFTARPLVCGADTKNKGENKGASRAVNMPHNGEKICEQFFASEKDIETAHKAAMAAFSHWNKAGGKARADILRAMADALQDNMVEFVALMACEAGKTFSDSINEVREAIDFLRYYAADAERLFTDGQLLPGPAGETDMLYMRGRGVFVCISPWNFPLAIFTGQIAAALAAGNTVLAKPAEQTPLTAYKAVKLFQKAGLPADVLHLLPGLGESVGAALVDLPNIAGVCFTGSTSVAKTINLSLAQKAGPIPVLIAETGGLNAMFVDTSALREQVIGDVVASAFNAAGQRCSALRILFVPEETADMLIEGLKGAMDALVIGDPRRADTDVGPVIDNEALTGLKNYVANLPASMQLIKQCALPDSCQKGYYMPPTLIELSSLEDFNQEQFGPVLHVMRYSYSELNGLVNEFASKGYGLTMGIHSRLDSFAELVTNSVPAGNVYINRNIIGAVVGVQPFGGVGLSGTGPKAGGPHYVTRFATEVCIANNISATGGDPALLNLSE